MPVLTDLLVSVQSQDNSQIEVPRSRLRLNSCQEFIALDMRITACMVWKNTLFACCMLPVSEALSYEGYFSSSFSRTEVATWEAKCSISFYRVF